MAQTTQLAAGTTAATSANIVVASGAVAVVGIFTNSGTELSAAGDNFFATVLQTTPGQPNRVAKLDASNPSITLSGPNTFTVVRNASNVPVGVFSE